MNAAFADNSELDIERRNAADAYLIRAGYARPGELTEHEVLAGGVSSRTVRVAFADGREWVLKQALAKLRVQADWFSDPRRVHREALGMKTLTELTPPGSVPKLIFDDEGHHVLGMEAVPRPHENWKAMLLDGRVKLTHFEDFGKLLGMIHARSRQQSRQWEREFADRTFFETLRLEPYYEYAATQEPQAADFLHQLLRATRAQRTTLVHGDYSPKNVLIHADRVVLLDHEVIHWGDPAFDVGFALTHILAKYLHLPHSRSELLAGAHAFNAQHFAAYCDTSPTTVASDLAMMQRCVRHTLGCLLARVVGRSPLEYLTTNERSRLVAIVLRLMADAPLKVPELLDRFVDEIER